MLRADRVVTPETVISPGWLEVRDGQIAGLGEWTHAEESVIDLGPRIVAPGYVDVHVHGGDGAQVNGDRPEGVRAALQQIARFHVRHGTTSLLATTVSDTQENLLTTVSAIAEAVGQRLPGGATIAGIHLEGPWIARAKLGAHDPFALRLPDPDELWALSEASGGSIRMVTLAPELPRSDELIAAALELGIAVAIGHTDAGFEATRAAIDAGARHATHLFNAMAPLHHRRPGALTALLLDERVTLEVIADLQHVHPAVLQLAARSAPGRLVAVSDAISAAGLEPGSYEIGRMLVSVANSRATLATDPSTLAGSVLTMDAAVRNLVAVVGLSLGAAIAAATSTPAKALGRHGDRLGRLQPGMPADLVVLEPDLSVAATIVAGEAAFDPAGLLGVRS